MPRAETRFERGIGGSLPVLTATQREVVEASAGRVVFLGGPGAGKSLVLAERAVWLVERGQARAEEILVLAPSRRAALAIGEHVHRRLGHGTPITATSFHGLALSVLRRHYRELGYRGLPQLLSTARHVHSLRTSLADEDPSRWPHYGGVLRADALRKRVYDLAMGSAENGLDSEALRARVRGWGQLDLVEIVDFLVRQRERQREAGLIDFGELLASTARLLADNPRVADLYRRAYRHILVDEFEEASYAQASLLYSLVGEGTDLLIAGDPEEAINSYRSGSPSYLLSCAERLGAWVIRSTENRRSLGRVARLGSAVRGAFPYSKSGTLSDCRQEEGGEAGSGEESPSTAGRALDESGDPGYVVLRSFTYPSDEARWVATEVASLIRTGIPPESIAILFRSLSAPIARLVASELARLSVPHRVQISQGVLGEPLVRATVDLLRYLWLTRPTDRRDEVAGRETAGLDGAAGAQVDSASDKRADDDLAREAFVSLLDSPLAGLPPFGLGQLRRAVALAERELPSLENDGLEGLKLSDDLHAALEAFLGHVAALRPKVHWSASSLLWEVWRVFPAFRHDALSGGQAARAYSVLLDEVAALDRHSRFLGLPELLDLLADGYFESLASSPPRDAGGVGIVTVHQAKGREWAVVFLPGLTEGTFPLRRSPLDVQPIVARDLEPPAPGGGEPHGEDGSVTNGSVGEEVEEASGAGVDGEADPAEAAALLARVRQRRHSAEEWRVFGVAVSRARDGLYLSHSRRGADGTSAELPSRFLDVVSASPDVEVVPGDGVAELPHDVAGSVVHYRRRLASALPLERAQALYALHRIAEQWPEAVRPDSWWENVEETAGAAPPFPDGELYLSASRLGAYRDCPLGYAFGYHWRLGEAEGAPLTIGSLLHAVLEEYHRPDSTLPRTREALEARLEEVFDESAFRYRPVAAQARRALSAMLDAYFERYGHLDGTIAVEQPFRFAFGRHVVTGFVDRVDRLPSGELELLDYKTGSPMSAAEAKADLQLALYDLAFALDERLQNLGKPARVSYLYLKGIGVRADGKRSYAPTEESREYLTRRVSFYADAILAERFPSHRMIPTELPGLDPGELERAIHKDPCRFCGFGWVCPETERMSGDE